MKINGNLTSELRKELDVNNKTLAPVKEYIIKFKKIDGVNLKIGILGIGSVSRTHWNEPSGDYGKLWLYDWSEKTPGMKHSLINHYLEKLKNKEKCNVIILLTHLTNSPSGHSKDTEKGDKALADNINSKNYADLIVGGHIHSVYPNDGRKKKIVYKDKVPITKSTIQHPKWKHNIGVTKLTYDTFKKKVVKKVLYPVSLKGQPL